MEIFRQFVFEAAHRLPHVPEAHKCARMHGHSYEVTLWLRGEIDPEKGWFVDWGDLDSIADEFRAKLDHRTLNDVAGLENPTCENLVKWIWAAAFPLVPRGVLLTVQVNEGPRSGARFGGDTLPVDARIRE